MRYSVQYRRRSGELEHEQNAGVCGVQPISNSSRYYPLARVFAPPVFDRSICASAVRKVQRRPYRIFQPLAKSIHFQKDSHIVCESLSISPSLPSPESVCPLTTSHPVQCAVYSRDAPSMSLWVSLTAVSRSEVSRRLSLALTSLVRECVSASAEPSVGPDRRRAEPISTEAAISSTATQLPADGGEPGPCERLMAYPQPPYLVGMSSPSVVLGTHYVFLGFCLRECLLTFYDCLCITLFSLTNLNQRQRDKCQMST